ncbi:hypothetical protein SXCC_03436 [Gluconacetobacter sp. SXCC-1]|nr:hypothetical protein SXCC_03436 [Gluconacetobacter sp. SXCC-1]
MFCNLHEARSAVMRPLRRAGRHFRVMRMDPLGRPAHSRHGNARPPVQGTGHFPQS